MWDVDKALEIIDSIKYIRKEDTGNIGGTFVKYITGYPLCCTTKLIQNIIEHKL